MRRALVVAVVVAALAAAAAASAGPAPGVYVTKVTGASPALLNGTWRLTLSKTRFAITRNGQPAIAGTVAITPKKITFHDLSGPFRCAGSQAVGSYGWRLHGKSLKLTAVKDACGGRKAVLSHTFTKS